MSMSKVLELARADLGYTENPPGSNRVKYWEDYNPEYQGCPWCVAFLWWVFSTAGERMAFFGGGKTASCSTLLRWYMEQGLMFSASEVQVGDIVLLNFHGGKDPEHCGLVVEVERDINGKLLSVMTIEGNTTPSEEGSQDNGGCVALKRRFWYQIVAVCRPQYKPEPEAKDDITGRWSEADVRWCIENSLMEGYPDGSWKPKQAVTREELAVVLRRFHRFTEDDGK